MICDMPNKPFQETPLRARDNGAADEPQRAGKLRAFPPGVGLIRRLLDPIHSGEEQTHDRKNRSLSLRRSEF